MEIKDDLCCPPLRFPNWIVSKHKREIPWKKGNTKTTLLFPLFHSLCCWGNAAGYTEVCPPITANMHPWYLYPSISFLDIQSNYMLYIQCKKIPTRKNKKKNNLKLNAEAFAFVITCNLYVNIELSMEIDSFTCWKFWLIVFLKRFDARTRDWTKKFTFEDFLLEASGYLWAMVYKR